MILEKQTILTAKDLSKTFSNGTLRQQVLKNLNLSIYKGDFTVIMGNSGSGKSTLLYALSGMDRPSMGNISYYTGEEKAETQIQSVLPKCTQLPHISRIICCVRKVE